MSFLRVLLRSYFAMKTKPRINQSVLTPDWLTPIG